MLPALLGYAGLIPFVVLGTAVWFVPVSQTDVVERALLSYAACILAFMAAVHWGIGMAGNANSWQLGLSVIPALLAWIAMNIQPPLAYSVLIVSFSFLCIADTMASRRKFLPVWYPQLRIPLTVIVILSLISGGFGR